MKIKNKRSPNTDLLGLARRHSSTSASHNNTNTNNIK